MLGATSDAAADQTTQPFPGVTIDERTVAGPNRVYVASTQLCTPGVRVEARSPQATRLATNLWAEAMGAQVATNGDFWLTNTPTPVVYGDAVGVGIRWPAEQSRASHSFGGDPTYQLYGWIAFGEGWVEFMHDGWVKQHADELGITEGYLATAMTDTIPDGTRALVSGFPDLVVEGQVLSNFPMREDCAVRHPRTAMGLSEDRRTFILAVVDGRSGISVGMTCAELASLMKDVGAHTAFNLDGGGSSLMWVAGRGTINAPSDGAPRPVANHWGVFSSGMATPAVSCNADDEEGGTSTGGSSETGADGSDGGGGTTGGSTAAGDDGGGNRGTGEADDGTSPGDQPGVDEPRPGRASSGCRIAGGGGSGAAFLLLVAAATVRRRRR